jgi:hypothetical protein
LASSLLGVTFALAARAQGAPQEAGAAGTEGPVADIDRARALAKQANRALHRASYAEALDCATRAEALHHAPFHLAIIGGALAGMGRGAEAMETLERLVSERLPPTAPEAALAAQEEGRRRLNELTARVPSLLLVVKGPPPSAVSATVDGKALSLAGNTATRFDPGSHKLHAEAPGYAPFDLTVTLPPKGGVVAVDALFEARPPAGVEQRGTKDAVARPPSRAPGAVVLSLGIAGLVVGGVTGGLFLSRLAALKARCPENRCSSADELEARSIGTLGNVSTAGLVVGGVGVVVGGAVLLSQRSSSKSTRASNAGGEGGFALELAPGGVTARGWF